MYHAKGRPGRRSIPAPVRMALVLCLTLAAFCTAVLADGVSEAQTLQELQEAEVKAAVETYLRNYAREAMLYEAKDQRAGTVYEPQFVPAWEGEKFRVNGKEVFLTELQKNIQFLEKKAAYYAAVRQMQNIYREDLQLHYTYRSLKMEEYSARVSVRETATFYYTDSHRQSVYETGYVVYLVKFTGRWLVADVSDGSGFDEMYKKNPDFDLTAALEEFSAGLKAEEAVLTAPYEPDPGAGDTRILYNGKNAAAYAATYCRPDEKTSRKYYNPRFKSYAGQGGDCMNFASQSMWAGFGGSQTAAAIDGHAAPMDTEGAETWYGRTSASGTKDSDILNWISCSSFWKYLNGEKDKTAGSNQSADNGMYATIITAPWYSPITGVSPEELIGAVAHVSGSGGNYSHAIVLTAAVGNQRGEIWYCSHTADESHIKLGDYYFGPVRVYIPRYMRISPEQKPVMQPEPIAPVLVHSSGRVGFRTEMPQARLSIVVETPDGTRTHAALAENAAECGADFAFTQAGLYRVDCTASTAEGVSQELTYYIRCTEKGIRAAAPPAENPEIDPEAEVPWTIVPETGEEVPPEDGTDLPPAEADASLLLPVD